MIKKLAFTYGEKRLWRSFAAVLKCLLFYFFSVDQTTHFALSCQVQPDVWFHNIILLVNWAVRPVSCQGFPGQTYRCRQ